jgi:hypothetical protein
MVLVSRLGESIWNGIDFGNECHWQGSQFVDI